MSVSGIGQRINQIIASDIKAFHGQISFSRLPNTTLKEIISNLFVGFYHTFSWDSMDNVTGWVTIFFRVPFSFFKFKIGCSPSGSNRTKVSPKAFQNILLHDPTLENKLYLPT